jgi:DNA-binding HxlR family transcriptional regulator
MGEVHKVCFRFHVAIELIGAKWAGAVLRSLFTGAQRFVDIKASIPLITDTMLTQRLRDLEEAGLVVRRVMPSSPVRVQYELTEAGRELEPILDTVIAWSHRWIPLPKGDDDADSHAKRLAAKARA